MSFSASPPNYTSHFSWTPPNSLQLPHPLRSHDSTEDFMAEITSIDESTRQSEILPSETVVLGRTRSRSFHRRTRSIHSWDGRDGLHVIAAPQVPATILPASPRFGHSSSSHPSTPTNVDYPVVPVRPPLRPTVSFGSVSQHSYDSTTPVLVSEKFTVDVGEEEVQDGAATVKKQDWKFWGCFGWLCLLKFMCDYGMTSLATALPHVARDLNLPTLESFWIPGSYLLVAALTQPLFMRLSLALSCKAILFFGLILFTFGSIVSTIARDFSIVLIGRSFEGIGCGAISMLTQLTMTRLLLENDRIKFTKLASLLFWLGVAVGPMLGAVLTELAGWRTVFYIQVGMSATCLLGLPWLSVLSTNNDGPVMPRLRHVDFSGWLLLAGGVTPMVAAISFGGILHPWIAIGTLLPLVVGLVALSGWAMYSYCRANPIIPVSIFRNKSAAVSCFGAMVHGALLTAVIFFMPVFHELSGLSLIVTGLCLAPWTIGLFIANLLAGSIMTFSGYRLAIWFGWALATLGIGLMIIIRDTTSSSFIVPISLIGGMAMGLLIPSLTKAIQSVASKDDEVINAEAIHLCFNTFGQCLGIIISASIFLNALKAQVLGNRNLIDDAMEYWTHATSVITRLGELEERIQANLISNFIDALRPVWIATCATAGLALVLSLCFTEGHNPRRHRVSLLAELE